MARAPGRLRTGAVTGNVCLVEHREAEGPSHAERLTVDCVLQVLSGEGRRSYLLAR